jgi:hypothetical protein
MPRSPLRFLLLALLCAFAPALRAQVLVRVEVPRHLFICYEPIVATVTITNMTGRDLVLADKAPDHWFSFEIMNDKGMPIPPTAREYHLDPLTIPMGQTAHRKVNLVNLYPVTDFGAYHVRAVIFATDKYYASPGVAFEVSEGTTLWSQTVGIPDGEKGAGTNRSYELLSFRQPKDNMLYVRIQDKEAGIVYATLPLGRLVNGYNPDVQIDALSHLHILQMDSPKEYIYTRLSPNAELLGQQDFTDLKTRPHLRKTPSGDVTIAGGIEVQQKTPQEAAAVPTGPKLSDRPPGLPAQ